MMPKRIQLRRTKGWRKPEGAVVVSRPSKWGNVYVPEQVGQQWGVRDLKDGELYWWLYPTEEAAIELALKRYRTHILKAIKRNEVAIEDLRGRDLVCWCGLDHACHVDVLLELANKGD